MITIPEVSRETDEKFMREALRQARKAYALQEVPIGCVIVYEGQIIARGYNRRNTDRNTISHAEINAIRRASKKLGDWRLEGCTIYITLEPCQMCAGAIVQSRITRAVIGSMNPKAGCAGSVLNLLEMSEFNHQVLVERDVLREQCSDMLSGFFRELREIKKLQKEAARLQVEENSDDSAEKAVLLQIEENSDDSAEKAASSQIEMSTTILQENPQETVDE